MHLFRIVCTCTFGYISIYTFRNIKNYSFGISATAITSIYTFRIIQSYSFRIISVYTFGNIALYIFGIISNYRIIHSYLFRIIRIYAFIIMYLASIFIYILYTMSENSYHMHRTIALIIVCLFIRLFRHSVIMRLSHGLSKDCMISIMKTDAFRWHMQNPDVL